VWDVDPVAETVAVYRADAPLQAVVYRRGDVVEVEPPCQAGECPWRGCLCETMM
jgi:hypothetical protein